jgi:hypothetical protein
MPEFEGLPGLLDSFRFPPSVEEALIDAEREPSEKLESAGRPVRGQELIGPASHPVSRVGLKAFNAVSEIRHFVGAILDRKDPQDILEIKFRSVRGLVLDAYGTVEAQILCALRKPPDTNVIAESVL